MVNDKTIAVGNIHAPIAPPNIKVAVASSNEKKGISSNVIPQASISPSDMLCAAFFIQKVLVEGR